MTTETKMLTEELKERCLDFAKRFIFKGRENLTEARRKKLWSDAEWFLTDCLEEGYTSWDGQDKESSYPPGDWFHERFDEMYFPNTPKWDRRLENGEEPRYLHELNVVCRLAFDVIDNMPGGVWGISLGELRRMYGGQIPEWLNQGWLDKKGNPADLNQIGHNEDIVAI